MRLLHPFLPTLSLLIFGLLASLPALHALPSTLDRRDDAYQTECRVLANADTPAAEGPDGSPLMTVNITDTSGNPIASGQTVFSLQIFAGEFQYGQPVSSSQMKYEMVYRLQGPPDGMVELPPGQVSYPNGWFTFQYAAWGPVQNPITGAGTTTISTEVSYLTFPCWLYPK